VDHAAKHGLSLTRSACAKSFARRAWYHSNLEADPADSVHGPINTQLESY